MYNAAGCHSSANTSDIEPILAGFSVAPCRRFSLCRRPGWQGLSRPYGCLKVAMMGRRGSEGGVGVAISIEAKSYADRCLICSRLDASARADVEQARYSRLRRTFLLVPPRCYFDVALKALLKPAAAPSTASRLNRASSPNLTDRLAIRIDVPLVGINCGDRTIASRHATSELAYCCRAARCLFRASCARSGLPAASQAAPSFP